MALASILCLEAILNKRQKKMDKPLFYKLADEEDLDGSSGLDAYQQDQEDDDGAYNEFGISGDTTIEKQHDNRFGGGLFSDVNYATYAQ